jgi:aminoglycoside 2'-N-acetyltransferase I
MRLPHDGRPNPARIRRLATHELDPGEIGAIREIMTLAFGDDEEEAFTDADWAHALGGTHVVVELDGEIVSHAAVVERALHVDDRPVRTGYVEAVATRPDRQGEGHGTRAMLEVNAVIRDGFELGALGTGSHHFYERLGWIIWQGPTFVRTEGGLVRTPDEDGGILVLDTLTSPRLDLGAPLSCEWRPGDVW